MRRFPLFIRNDFLSNKELDSLFKPLFLEQSPWKEKDNKYKLSVDLPGLKKDDISLEVEDQLLSISGKREFDTENGSTFKEYNYSVSLPEDLNVDSLDANYENGVLVLTSEKLVELKNKKLITVK